LTQVAAIQSHFGAYLAATSRLAGARNAGWGSFQKRWFDAVAVKRLSKCDLSGGFRFQRVIIFDDRVLDFGA
jgi:hypothetical protein